MATWIGLALSLVSAAAVNWAYTREHEAAQRLPPLAVRRPLAAVRTLLASRAWLLGFATESGGWLLYLVALRLAPLALVQTVGAAGIAVLAALQCRGVLTRLSARERGATALAVGGLALLGLSLVGAHPASHAPAWAGALLWLGGCLVAAGLVSLVRVRLARAAALGLAAGFLFAAGDISAKLVVAGGEWLALAPLMAAAYALGSLELQAAFQHGAALTAAGLATVTTNAVPIAAGVTLLREGLPGGVHGALRVAAFALLAGSGALLSDPRARGRPARLER